MAYKRQELARRKQLHPLREVQAAAERADQPMDLVASLRARQGRLTPALIAEIKFASPSKGVLLAGADALCLGRVYQANGAAAISVLTDERYFHGRLEYLAQISQMTPRLPVLRKDFIFDPYQVYEARANGADAILLIVAALQPQQLLDLHELIQGLGMTPLLEVHDLGELEVALRCQPRLVGVNNRDLHSLQVNLETTLRLRPCIPAEVCLAAESGIHSRTDVRCLAEAGVDAMLVGEALVTAADIGAKVRELVTVGTP